MYPQNTIKGIKNRRGNWYKYNITYYKVQGNNNNTIINSNTVFIAKNSIHLMWSKILIYLYVLSLKKEYL